MSQVPNTSSKSSQSEELLEKLINEDEKSDEPEATSRWTLKAFVKSIFIMLVIGLLISHAYYVNDESQRALETRFGKLVRITGPGVYFKLPFIESYQQYQINKQRQPYKSVSTASSDNYTLYGKIILEYSLCEVSTEEVDKYEEEPEEERIIVIEEKAPQKRKTVIQYLMEILQSIFVSKETDTIDKCGERLEYIHHYLPSKDFYYVLQDIKTSTLSYWENKENFYHYLNNIKTSLSKYLDPKNQEHFDDYLKNIVTSTFKNEMGKLSMTKVPNDRKKRKKLENQILEQIKKKVSKILKIEVHDFRIPYYGWSQSFLLKIQKNEDNKEALDAAKWAKNRTKKIAEQEKNQAEKTIEDADNEVKVTQANAKAEAALKKIKAKAEANAKLTNAKAEAYAIHQKGEAQAAVLKAQVRALDENPHLIESEKMKRWDGKLPSYFLHQKISPFMSPVSNETLPIQSPRLEPEPK